MSSYATLAQLKAHVGQSVDPPGLYDQLTDLVNATTANDTVGAARLDAAESFINGKLGSRYTTPINVAAGRLAGGDAPRLHPGYSRVESLHAASIEAADADVITEIPCRWPRGSTRRRPGRQRLPERGGIPAVSSGPSVTAVGDERFYAREYERLVMDGSRIAIDASRVAPRSMAERGGAGIARW
jgi:hypothetical protein